MTFFTDQDIGDLAEEILGTLAGMKRALRSKLPHEIGASMEREAKLKLTAERILETLGRRQPSRRYKQLTIVDDADNPTGMPD